MSFLGKIIQLWRLSAFLIAFTILFSSLSYAATYYWVGPNGGDIATAANWSSSDPASCGVTANVSVPGASDTVVFDADCDNTAAFSANWSVAGVSLASGYTGTLTQSGVATLTVGSSGYAQAGGTFTGGSGTITMTGNFTVSGGTFTSTSSTFTLTNVNWDTSTGTFIHNNGSVVFQRTSNGNSYIYGVTTFYDLTLGGASYNIRLSDDLVVNHDLALSNGYNNSSVGTMCDGAETHSITVKGNVTKSNAGYVFPSVTIVMAGTSGQTISDTGTSGVGGLKISNTAAAVVLGSDLNIRGDFTIDASAQLDVTASNYNITFVPAQDTSTVWTNNGTFNYRQGSVTIAANSSNANVVLAGTLTFYNLTFSGSTNNGHQITADVTVHNNLSVTRTYNHSGILYGDAAHNIYVAGNAEVTGATSINANLTVVLNGTSAQTLSTTSTGSFGDIKVSNTAAAVSLASNLLVGDDITVDANTIFNLATYNLTGTASTTFVNNGTLRLSGDNTITLATPTNNAGSTVEYTATTGTRAIQSWTYQNLKVNGASSGLRAYWPLDEIVGGTCSGGGDSCDSSGNNYHGIWTSMTSTSTSAPINTSNSHSAQFNGDDAYIETTASSTILSGDSSFTVTAWFKTALTYDSTDNNVGGRLLTIYSSAAGAAQSSKIGLGFYGTGANTLMLYYNNGSPLALTGTATNASNNAWHHAAATYDASTNLLTLYYDGAQIGQVDAGTIIDAGTEPVRLGTHLTATTGVNGGHFEGLIDDVRIYTSALVAADVLDMYKGYAPGGTFTLSGSTMVNDDLTIVGGLIDGNGQNFTITNDTAISGGALVTGTGTVTFGDTAGDALTVSGGILSISSDNMAADFIRNATFTQTSGAVAYTGTGVTTTLITGLGANDVVINGSGSTYTLDGNWDLNGNLRIALGTLDASGSNYNINISGNWTNNATFTPRSGTVTLDGTNQTIMGSTTFYNFTKTDATNNSTDATLTFDNAGTQRVNGLLTLTGTDANDRVNLVSDIPGRQWSLNAAGTFSTNYLDVTDSDASTGTRITTTNSVDGGNNINWDFSVSRDVAGVLYRIDEITPVTGFSRTVNLRVNGGTVSTDTTDPFDGSFSFSNIVINDNDTLTLYTSSGNTANTVVVAGSAILISGIQLINSHVVLQSFNVTGTLAMADLVDYDNDENATTMLFDADLGAPNTLTTESGIELLIAAGTTFTPNGTVTLSGGLDINGTWVTTGAEALSVGGNWDATGGIFTAATGTVTFTGTGLTVISGGTDDDHDFNDVVINLSGSTNTFGATTNDMDVDGNLTLTRGTMSITTDITLAGNLVVSSTNIDNETSSGEIVFDGAGLQTITNASGETAALAEFVIANTSVQGVRMDNAISVGSEFIMNASARFDCNGYDLGFGRAVSTWTVDPTATFITGANTITFQGDTTTVTTGGTDDNHDFNNVTISVYYAGTNFAMLTNDMDVDGNLTLNRGVVAITTDITLAGNLIISSANINTENGAGEIVFDGTGLQTISNAVGETSPLADFMITNTSVDGVRMDNPISVGSDFVMSAGTKFDCNGYDLSMGNGVGEWTIDATATFITGNNTVTFLGRDTTVTTGGTDDNHDFNNVVMILLDQWQHLNVVTNDMDVDGNLTMTRGIFSPTTDVTLAGNLIINGTNILTEDDVGELIFDGAGLQTITNTTAVTAGVAEFVIANTSPQGVRMDNAVSVSSEFVVNSGARFDCNGYDLTFTGGTWTVDPAGTFITGANTVVFQTSNATITTGGTDDSHDFNNVTMSLSTGQDFIVVTNDMDIDGNFVFNGGDLNITTDITLAGNLSVTSTNTGAEAGTGEIIFDGVALQTITNAVGETDRIAEMIIANSSSDGVRLDNTIAAGTEVIINAGGRLNLNGNNFTVQTTFTNNGILALTGDETTTTPTNNAGSTVEYVATSGTRAIKEWTYASLKVNGPGSGLVGWWKLDEASGTTAVDSSIYGNNGTWVGSPLASTNVAPVLFSNPRSLTFNGSSQYITVANTASQQISNNQTVSVWAKRATSTSTGALVERSGSSFGVLVGITPCSANQVKLTKFGIVDICLGSFPSDTSWHHVTGVWSTSGVSLYIDGVLSGTNASTSDFLSQTGTLYIGNGVHNVSYFSGLLDDVRLYNRALSAAEVAVLYEGSEHAGGVFTLASGKTLSENLTVSGGILDASDLTLSVQGNTILSGGLFKTGTNTITLGNAGGDSVTFSGGTLAVEADNTSADLVINAGTWTPTSGTVAFAGATVTTTIPSTITYPDLVVKSTGSTYTLGGNTDVNGSLRVAAGTLDASAANNYDITVGGDWHNNATFTARQGTVTFDGTSQNILGSTTFYDLTKADATNNGTSETLTFDNTSVQTVSNLLTLDGLDANDLVVLRSDVTGKQWDIKSTGTFAVDYVDVQDSVASQGNIITTTNSTNSGNNIDWGFGITDLLGVAYANDRTTPLTGTSRTIGMRINGGAEYTDTTDPFDGTFSFSLTPAVAGDTVTVYFRGATETGNTVTSVNGTDSVTFFKLADDHLIIRSDNAPTALAITDLAKWDNDNSAANMVFTANAGALTVETGHILYVESGHTFRPAGNVTSSTSGVIIAGTWEEAGSETFTVNGVFNGTGGTYTRASGTIVFPTSSTITPGSCVFGNVNFTVNYYSISISGTMYVAGNLYSAKDDSHGISGNITLTGAVDQTVTSSSGYGFVSTTLTVDKSGGSALLGNNATITTVVINNSNTFDVTTNNYTLTSTTFTNNGTFNARNGTVYFSLGSSTTPGSSVFNNVNFSTSYYSSSITGTLYVAGNLTSTKDSGHGVTGNITLNGSADQTVTASNGYGFSGTTLTIDKSGGSALLGSNAIMSNLLVNNTNIFDVTAGNYTLTLTSLTNNGTFTARNGTVVFDGASSITPGSSVFNHVSFTTGYNNVTITGTLYVAGNLASSKDSSRNITGNIRLTGGVDQTLTSSSNYGFRGTTLTIDKSGGSALLGSVVAIGAVTINASNTLDLVSYNVTVSGAWANNGTLKLQGDQTITGTPTNNAGSTVEYTAATGTRAIKEWTYASLKINGPESGLVGWWKLDEASGTTAVDSSIYGNNGTWTGGLLPTSNRAPVIFKNPRGLSFDGIDDYLRVGDVSLFNLGTTSNVTVAAWVKFNQQQLENSSGVYYGAIAGKGFLDNTVGYGLFTNNSGASFQVRNGGTIEQVTGSVAINDGAWHFVVGTFDRSSSTGVKLYIDGVVQAATANGTTFNAVNLDTTREFTIGTSNYSAGFRFDFLGQLDDVRVYKRSLSADEITVLYEGSEHVGGVFTLATGKTLSENLTVAGGIFDASDLTLSVQGNTILSGGLLKTGTNTITLGNAAGDSVTFSGGTLAVEADNVASDFVVNAATINTTSGAVAFVRAAASDTIPSSISYPDLVIKSSGGTYTLGGNIDVNGTLSVAAGSLDTSAANNYDITVAGDWHNNATFTARQGEVTFDGTSQTILGNTTFYDFTKLDSTNNSMSETLTFDNTATQTVTNNLSMNALDADDMIILRSDVDTKQWDIKSTGAQTVDYVDVKDSSAAQGNTIATTNATNSGNNINWGFGITDLLGVAYANDRTTPLTGTSRTIGMRINGGVEYTDTTDPFDGVFSFSLAPAAAGDTITVYFKGATEKGNTVTAANGVDPILYFKLADDHLIVRSDNAPTALAITDLAKWDNDNDSSNMVYTANAGALTVESGNALYVETAHVFTPGGNVTLSQGGLIINGTWTATGTESLAVSGSWTNNGTFTPASGTVTVQKGVGFASVTLTGATTFYNLILSGGTNSNTTVASDMIVQNNLDVTVTSGDATDVYTDGSTRTISVAGNVSHTGTTSFDRLLIINLNGTGSQTVVAAGTGYLGGLTLSNTSNPVTLAGNLGLAGPLLINPSTTLDVTSNNYVITLINNWTNNGTFLARSGSVNIVKALSAAPTITGATTFYDLTFSGTTWNVGFTVSDDLVVTRDFSITETSANPTTRLLSDGAETHTILVGRHMSFSSNDSMEADLTIVMNGTTAQNLSTSSTGQLGSLRNSNTTNAVSLISNLVMGAGTITIDSGAILNLGAYNVTRTSATAFTNNGTLRLTGDNTFTLATPTNNAGSTVEYTASSGTRAIKDWTYVNLNINGAESASPVGWWKMDEVDADTCAGGEDACDASGNGTHAVLTNGAYSMPDTAPLRYGNHRAVDFDGTNDYLLVSSSAPAALNLTTGFTLSLWVKPDTNAAVRTMLSAGVANTSGFQVYANCSTAGDVCVARHAGATTEVIRTSAAALTNSTYAHVLLTVSGTTVTVYVNGTSQALTGSWTGNIADYLGSTYRIGSRQDGATYWDGRIDDVRVYNRVLSAAEIAGLYEGYKTPGGTFTMGAGETLSGNLTLTTGIFDVNDQTLTVSGGTTTITSGAFKTGTAAVSLGNVTVNDGSVVLESDADADLTVGTWTNNGGAVVYADAAANSHAIRAAFSPYNDLIVSSHASAIFTLNEAVVVNADFAMNAGNVNAGSGSDYDLTVNGIGSFLIRGGVYTAYDSDITVGGDFYSLVQNGFIEGTSRLVLTGSGYLYSPTNSSCAPGVYSVSMASAGNTTVILSASTGGVVTLGDGTVSGTIMIAKADGQQIFRSGSSTINLNMIYCAGAGYVSGIDCGSSSITLRPSTTTYVLTGNLLTTGSLFIGDNSGGGTATLDTTSNNYSIEIGGWFRLGRAAGGMSGRLIANSSTVNLASFSVGLDGASNILDAQNATINVAGSWSNTTGATINPGTSTVNFVATSGTPTITSGGGAFNNLNFASVAARTYTIQDALTVNGNLTINADNTLDVNSGGNYAVNVGGNWTNNGTFTSRSGTVTLNGAAGQTVTAGASAFNNLTVTNAAAAGVTFTDAWTAANFTDITPGSVLKFQNSTTYTVTSALTLTGTRASRISLNTDDGIAPAFAFDVTGGAQTVSYLTVANSNASTNNITANHSINNSGNDNADVVPHWIFPVTSVYYAVGQNTSDHKSGSPTITITSGTATFSVAQTATNLGIGDKVTYNTTSVAYITGKISTSQWTLMTATGDTPADVTAQTVNSISHPFSSLSSAVTGASGASYLNATDLVARNYQLNFPCYYDSGADTTYVVLSGYTTGVSNYIKVYTPNNTTTEVNLTQRHAGKWDSTKYNLSLARANNGVINASVPHLRLEGLQLDNTTTSYAYGLELQPGTVTCEYYLTSNIVRKTNTSTVHATGIYILSQNTNTSVGQRLYAANNLIYDQRDNGFWLRGFVTSIKQMYLSNNTVINSGVGVQASYSANNANVVVNLKNNISFGNTTDYDVSQIIGSPTTSYITNLSSDATSPNAALRNKIISFIDATNKDYHLLPTDASAKNAGTDLSADANLPFSTDIDGQTRTGTWDIGADEGATPVYYAVGQNTNDHKTGSPTVSITSGVATFSEAQTATNMGVGDKVTYNGSSVAYISGKTSTSVWSLVTATGGMPPDVVGQTVNSIAHPFASLASAVTGASGASYLNTSDLFTGNYQLNIPCYYDTGADTTGVTLSGYTTSFYNYIKLYVPNNTTSEVNQSQRHGGKWDATKYRLETNNGAITVNVNFAKVDGLQVRMSRASAGTVMAISKSGTTGLTTFDVSNNIIVGNLSGGAAGYGIQVASSLDILYAYNNIIYNFSSTGSRGLYNSFRTAYVYNNTFASCETGLVNVGVTIAKNNIFKSNSVAASGTFNAGTDYNATDNASMGYTVTGSGNTHDKVSQVFSFVDVANNDYHLSSADNGARNLGTDLSADANLPFSTDIDGGTRSGLWDLGADESTALAAVGSMYFGFDF